jgi:5-methylcytosine-specific restriction endonuclease McrA
MSGYEARRQRLALARTDPTCWYCGIVVVEYNPAHGAQQPDQATLEHLVSKRNPLRRDFTSDRRRVLACYDCNNSRGDWTALLMREDQRLRAEAEIAWRPTIAQLVAMT